MPISWNSRRFLFACAYICVATFCSRVCAQTSIKTIASTGDLSFPSSLLEGADDNLYGTTAFGGGPGTAFRLTRNGVLTQLHQFNSGPGHEPNGPLVKAADGNFYGVVAYGPTVAESAVFRMTPNGTTSIVYQFTGPDGSQIEGGLTLGRDGNLYGVGYSGGQYNHGTVFRLSLDGALTILHHFQGSTTDGDQPGSPPIETSDRTLYGTTYRGGSTADVGTVYRISATGVYTILHVFNSFADSRYPIGLIQASDGNFYGCVKSSFGTPTDGSPTGKVFRMTLSGDVTIVHQFTDGFFPNTKLMQADDGFIYGTTRKEKINGPPPRVGDGTLFRFSTGGEFTSLHSFIGDPWGAVMQASDRNLYFTLLEGTIFKITLVSPKLGNISTRLRVGPGDDALIAGFIVTGTQPKKVIVRAIGPSVPVPTKLLDPILELHTNDGQLITNDNWRDTQENEIAATTLAPSDTLESAIVATLAPGAHTAIVRGKNNTTGVGLVEVYDLNRAADSKPANVSTRGVVQTGDDVMIAGTIVTGTDSTTLVIRALGPSLTNSNISNPLQDPMLELHDGNGMWISANDDWRVGQDQEPLISGNGLAPQDEHESVIAKTVPPGNYTAIVRGKNDSIGVALVEVYQLTN